MDTVSSPSFGKLLKRYRLAAGLTQEALAERANLSVRAVSDLERGLKTRPHRDTVELLAEGLRLPPEDRASLQAAVRRGHPPLSSTGRVAWHADQRLPIGGFLGALPCGPLVHRDAELQRVLAAVDAAVQGMGRLVVLVGEPGVGKTRLGQEVTVYLQNREFLVAAGRCYEPQQVVPYYPFLDALAQLYLAAPRLVRAEAGKRWPYLGQLLPDELGRQALVASGGPDDQQRLFRAVTALVQTVAHRGPVAFLLDDLQWADQASLDLLQHLARHTRADSVFLLGLYRDVEVPRRHPLDRMLGGLHRDGLLERVEVRCLDLKGMAALIATSFGQEEVSTEFAELVYRHTEGNPFYTHEVLRTLVERGDIYREDGRWERREIEELSVPESVRSAIGERLSRLKEETRELLHEASVLGQTFAFEDLRAMGNHSEDAVERALGEAAAAGLVRAAGKDDYTFNHALTQQALYAELAPRRKRRLHLAAGAALEQLPERMREQRVAELALHLLAGDDLQRALPYVLQAGDQAEAVFAHAEAERQYRTALELARELDDPPREAEAFGALGAVLTTVARYDEALELLHRSAQLFRAEEDVASEVRIAEIIGTAHRGRGTLEEGITYVQAVLDRLEDGGRPEHLAALYATVEPLYFSTGRYAEELAAAERIAELARLANDDGLLARAESARGTALVMLGRVKEGIAVLELALPLAERAQPTVPVLGRVLLNLGNHYAQEGDLARSRWHLERCLELTERSGGIQSIAFPLSVLGVVDMLRGDWVLARAELERCVGMARAASSTWWGIYPLLELGRLKLHTGEWDEATRLLEEGLATAARNRDLQALRLGQPALAELELVTGNAGRARSRLEPLLHQPDLDEVSVAEMLPVTAQVEMESGREQEAERWLQLGIEWATSQTARLALVGLLRVLGMLRSRQGRWAEAETAFGEALELARSMPYPYAEARALYEWGRMQGAKGDPVLARQRLEEALVIFRRLGARPYVERTERALRSDEETSIG